MSKDYYRTLGVLDNAENIVIKAAYKALAQRYHPDKWTGNKGEATRRMYEINEAYDVLSDPVKRRAYDSQRDRNAYQPEPDENELNSSVDTVWKNVIEFFPDLIDIAGQLGKISKSLESSYKITLLEQKEWNSRRELAHVFETQFLERYFGTNKKIIEYVKTLIFSDEREAVKAVNQAVNLLGSEVDPSVIINKIDRDWNVGAYRQKHLLATEILNAGARFNSIDQSIEFITKLEGSVTKSTQKDRYALIQKDRYAVTRSGTNTVLYLDKTALLEYAKKLANDFLAKKSI